MKLIVGLGNIGDKYNNTRHNIGFEVINQLANSFAFNEQFSVFENLALVLQTIIFEKKVLLIKPTTFMNNSGQALRRFKDYYKIENKDILIVFDDCNLNLGNIRLKENGSSGGHNGIKSIISHLGCQNFSRLKLGIGCCDIAEMSKFVLGKFVKSEQNGVEEMIVDAKDAVELWVKEGPEKVMQKFNKKND